MGTAYSGGAEKSAWSFSYKSEPYRVTSDEQGTASP
jgi:hypothetical protein